MPDPVLWSGYPAARLTPPGVSDARSRALVEMAAAMIRARDPLTLLVRRAEAAPAALLPALAVEASVDEYLLAPAPESVVRALIARSGELHALKGYDAGVRLALALFGAAARIEHWHQLAPRDAPNTQTIHAYVENPLFPDEDAYLSGRLRAAIERAVRASIRWSQDTRLAIGVGLRQDVPFAQAASVAIRLSGAATPQHAPRVGAFTRAFAHGSSIALRLAGHAPASHAPRNASTLRALATGASVATRLTGTAIAVPAAA